MSSSRLPTPGIPDAADSPPDAGSPAVGPAYDTPAARSAFPEESSSVGEEDPGAAVNPPPNGAGRERGGGEPYRRAVLEAEAQKAAPAGKAAAAGLHPEAPTGH